MRDPLHIERSSSTTRHTPPQHHHHHHHHQGPVRPHERRHAETGGSATTPPRATTTHSPARSIINHIDAPAAPAAPPTDISLGRAAPPQHRIARPSDQPPPSNLPTIQGGTPMYTADDPRQQFFFSPRNNFFSLCNNNFFLL
ncbi:uncharacterized protein LOC143913574 [Arctopsyche grandis]|uniref:uncharacterized protein LOC143913574 n=1 Tax=Arctopsyche grandis TaxID=121162 RepID=UPI00406DA495